MELKIIYKKKKQEIKKIKIPLLWSSFLTFIFLRSLKRSNISFFLSRFAKYFFFTEVISLNALLVYSLYLWVIKIGVLHLGQHFKPTALLLPSVNHFVMFFSSITCPQSTSKTNLASSSSSSPKNISVSSSFWQILHSGGQGSPQNPTHKCPHLRSLLQGSTQGGTEHIVPQVFLHFKWGQDLTHGSLHLVHGCPQFLLHLLWAHLLKHFFLHGKQALRHGILQGWPHINVAPQFSWHGLCIRPCIHSPQVPVQICSHFNSFKHGSLQYFSSFWLYSGNAVIHKFKINYECLLH